jgi:hypothetical protein
MSEHHNGGPTAEMYAAQAYEKFGRWVAETICDGDNWLGDIDGCDIGEKMLELGILQAVKYDPDKHGEIYFGCDPEAGDDVQIFAPGMVPDSRGSHE